MYLICVQCVELNTVTHVKMSRPSKCQTRKTSVFWDKTANWGVQLTQVRPLRRQLGFTYQVSSFATLLTVVPLLCGSKLFVPLWPTLTTTAERRQQRNCTTLHTVGVNKCDKMKTAWEHIWSTYTLYCSNSVPLFFRRKISHKFSCGISLETKVAWLQMGSKMWFTWNWTDSMLQVSTEMIFIRFDGMTTSVCF